MSNINPFAMFCGMNYKTSVSGTSVRQLPVRRSGHRILLCLTLFTMVWFITLKCLQWGNVFTATDVLYKLKYFCRFLYIFVRYDTCHYKKTNSEQLMTTKLNLPMVVRCVLNCTEIIFPIVLQWQLACKVVTSHNAMHYTAPVSE